MKILIVSPNYPYPDDKGDRIRVHRVIKIFEYLKFEIDLICLDSREAVVLEKFSPGQDQIFKIKKLSTATRMIKNLLLNKSFSSAHFQSADFVKALQLKLTATNYDFVVVFSSAFDYLIPIFHKHKTKVFWDLIDFDSLKWARFAKDASWWKRLLYQREAKLIKSAEEKIIDFAELVSIISQRELDRFQTKQVNLDQVFVLPQVIERMPTTDPILKQAQIVFTGQMNYSPNIEAVKFFDREVMPLVLKKNPNIIFKVAGRSPTEELINSSKNTTFTGEVANIENIVAESLIVVVPLKSVFGVPNKVLEGMSLGVPTVVTTEVAKTINAKIDCELLVADSAEEFANQIQKLLTDPALGEELSRNAISFIQEKFSVDVVGAMIQIKLKRLSS